MEQSSIVLTDEFRFLYLHHNHIKRFFNTGFLAEFSDIRYMTKHPDYYYDYGNKRKIYNGQKGKKKYELRPFTKYQWKKENRFTDYKVYESISFFIELIDYAGTNIGDKINIYEAIHKSIKITNYQKYIYSKEEITSIYPEIENIFYFILKSFNINFKEEEGEENLKNNNKVDDNEKNIIENLRNNIHLLRKIRNFFTHNGDNEARYFNHIDFYQFIRYQLYLFIFITHILRHNKFELIDEINEFIKNYDRDNNKHKLLCEINKETHFLEPFKKDPKLGSTDLDLTHQGAIFTPSGNGFHAERKSYELAPRITSEDLAKQLKDENKEEVGKVIALLNDSNNKISEDLQALKKEILKQLEEGNSIVHEWAKNIDKLIEDINNKTDKQTETLINKTDEQTKALNQKTDEQTKALNKKTDEQTEALKEKVEEQNKEFKRTITLLIGKVKRIIYSRVKIILALILSCIVLFGVNDALNKHAESLFRRTGYEFFLQKAHANGAHDLAYDHALALEKEERIKEACYWYAKAKERYAEIVFVNPDDSKAAYRLAQMLIRLKGGSDNITVDYQNALYYAKIAAKDYGYGLYVYINLILGNEDEALQGMLEIEDGNSIQDDYSKLAHILMQLHDIGMGDKEPLHIQDKIMLLDQLMKMCAESNKDVKQEAVIEWYNLSVDGLKMDGTYIRGCDFYEAEAVVRQNMNNVPLLVTYLTDIDQYKNYSLLEQVLEKLWQNEIRFLYPLFHDLIKRKMVSEPSYMKELNANIIQTDGLNALEAVRRYNLNIRHKHLQEETLGYIQYADSLAASDPMLWINKEALLISFLATKDSISVKDLETLPFVDKKSEALCNYLMGIKYAKGYGTKEDMEQADSYFMAAADKGLEIARYTWAVRLYKQGKTIPAIRILKPLAEKWDIAKIWLAYMMKNLDPESFESYLGQVKNPYQPYVTMAISAQLVKMRDLQSIELMNFNLRNSIGESMNCPEKNAILAGYLSQTATTIDESLFYAYWAINSDKEIGYQFFPGLAEKFKMLERPDLADKLIKDMCMVYFHKDGSTLDDKNKEAVISLLKDEYPYLVNQIAAEIGYNPTMSVDLNKDRKELIEPDFSMTLLPDECVLDMLNE